MSRSRHLVKHEPHVQDALTETRLLPAKNQQFIEFLSDRLEGA